MVSCSELVLGQGFCGGRDPLLQLRIPRDLNENQRKSLILMARKNMPVFTRSALLELDNSWIKLADSSDDSIIVD